MNIKNLFFEDSEEKNEEKPDVPTTQPVAAPPSPTAQPVWTTTASPTTTYQPQTSSNDIAKFMQYFEGLFDKSNLPGPDYYEFIKMHQAMPSVLTDDQKIQAAFAGVSAQGLTKEQLVVTAQKYIDIIDEDSKKFMAAIDTKALGEINRLKGNIQNSIDKLKEKSDLIAQLQSELIQDSANIEKIKSDLVGAEQKYQDNTSGYKIACEAKKAEINTNISKFNTLLK